MLRIVAIAAAVVTLPLVLLAIIHSVPTITDATPRSVVTAMLCIGLGLAQLPALLLR